jgi:O-antigen/teichoic acid export membrane protein
MKGLWEWMLKAGFSILDQGLISASNFGLSVALARMLPGDQYGAFALSFTIFLVISGFHNSLLVEPMSVLGPARHLLELVDYLRRTIWVHAAVMAVLAAIGVLAGVFFLSGMLGLSLIMLGPSLIAMSLTSPCILLFWLVRRAHYVETRPGLAAASSVIYCATLTVTTLTLWRLGLLSAVTAFVALGAAALVASLFSMMRLGLGFWPGLAAARSAGPVFRENWEFGRWIIPSAVFYPMLAQAQIFLTGGFLGLAAAGGLRALQNPILPVVQVITALATLAIPMLSRDFVTEGVSKLYRRGILYAGLMILIALSYEAVVLLTGSYWDRLLYSGRYSEYDALMPILGILPIAIAVATGSAVILRAIQRPELTAIPNIVGGTVGVGASYYLILHFGLPGAVYSMVASQILTAFISIVLASTARGRALATESRTRLAAPSSVQVG